MAARLNDIISVILMLKAITDKSKAYFEAFTFISASS